MPSELVRSARPAKQKTPGHDGDPSAPRAPSTATTTGGAPAPPPAEDAGVLLREKSCATGHRSGNPAALVNALQWSIEGIRTLSTLPQMPARMA